MCVSVCICGVCVQVCVVCMSVWDVCMCMCRYVCVQVCVCARRCMYVSVYGGVCGEGVCVYVCTRTYVVACGGQELTSEYLASPLNLEVHHFS